MKISARWDEALAFAVSLFALIAPATAADLGLPPVQPAGVIPVTVVSWTGLYIGANGGGIWTHSDDVTTVSTTGAPVTAGSGSRSGFIVGGQIGYNYLLAPSILVGIEVDSQYSSVHGTVVSPDGSNRHDSKFDYFGTARGRLGFVAGSSVLLYGTGGFAWSQGQITRLQVTGTLNGATAGTVETSDNSRTGWAAGGGIEWGFARDWTLRGEYLHLDLGAATSVFPLANRRQVVNLTADIVRVGLNYNLGWGGR